MTGGLSKQDIVELSGIRTGRWIAHLTLTWLTLITLVVVHAALGLGWWSLPLIALTGCLQNAMILWVHEGSHVNLFRDKAKNDFWADLVICGPVGVYLEAYRWHHGRHHRHLGDPRQEPEKSAYFCIRGPHLLKHALRHLFLIVAYTVVFRRERSDDLGFAPPPPRSKAAWAGFLIGNTLLVGLCALAGHFWMVVFAWALPLFTVATMISNFRTIVEHQPNSDVCESGFTTPVKPITRIVNAGPIERLLVCPIGFYYHYEHHLYPGIPYANLGEVRARLTVNGHFDAYESELVRSKGYLWTVWKLATDPKYGVR